MDERVYSVDVCSLCHTQVEAPPPGAMARCAYCDGEEGFNLVTVRFRVSRAAVVAQADPRQSLIERTVYFGCVGQAGHYYWARGSGGYPYRPPRVRGESGVDERNRMTPWGTSVDGGLITGHVRLRQGEAHIVHKDGWTALVFEDRSIDSRPGSWSVFCIPAILDGPAALVLAREAFPPIFSRYQFPVVLAVGSAA